MEGKEKKFEDLLKELETIVKELESGNIDLDVAIEKYTEAMKIAKKCNEKLTTASDKVAKILLESGKLDNFEISEN